MFCLWWQSVFDCIGTKPIYIFLYCINVKGEKKTDGNFKLEQNFNMNYIWSKQSRPHHIIAHVYLLWLPSILFWLTKRRSQSVGLKQMQYKGWLMQNQHAVKFVVNYIHCEFIELSSKETHRINLGIYFECLTVHGAFTKSCLNSFRLRIPQILLFWYKMWENTFSVAYLAVQYETIFFFNLEHYFDGKILFFMPIFWQNHVRNKLLNFISWRRQI